jgi:hypothetical protein
VDAVYDFPNRVKIRIYRISKQRHDNYHSMFVGGYLQNIVNWNAMVGWIIAKRGGREIAADFYLIRVSRYVDTLE